MGGTAKRRGGGSMIHLPKIPNAVSASSSIETVVRLNEKVLQCPCCQKGEYLTHSTIDVFQRHEDEEECLHTRTDGFVTTTKKTKGRGNPSSRRHGLSVELICEMCEGRSRLTLAQHKGTTIMEHFCIDIMQESDL